MVHEVTALHVSLRSKKRHSPQTKGSIVEFSLAKSKIVGFHLQLLTDIVSRVILLENQGGKERRETKKRARTQTPA